MPGRPTPPSVSLAAIRQPALRYDAGGRVAEANDLAEALAGRPLAGCSPADVGRILRVRRRDQTSLLPADLPASRALAGEEAVEVPLVITAADGSTFEVLVTASPVRDGDAIAGALVLWRAVPALGAARAGEARTRRTPGTAAGEPPVQEEVLREQGDEHVRTLAALDRQQRLLDGVLATMPHHVSLWDRDQRLVWSNERFAATSGEDRGALAGRTWREVWQDAPELGSLVEAALPSITAGAAFEREVEADGPAGPCWLAFTFLPIFGDSVLVISEDVTDRKAAGMALAASEARYRALFETMNEGFMVVEPVLDEHGVPVSFRHLEVNPAKERLSGRTREELVGRDARETAPGIEDRFVRTYARVALTGEPAHLEEYAAGLGRWLSADVYRPEPGKAAVVVSDVTARKEGEAALREDERRHAFFLALGDRLRDLDDAAAIAAAASGLLGRHLGANGVVYCEVDAAGEVATVRADWTDGTVPSATGSYRMDDFGIGDRYRRGEVRRTRDVTEAHDQDEAAEHDVLRIRASLGVPLCRGGRLAAVLAAHSATPRTWTEAEVELVRHAGDRIWAAVERARAVEALRESEADARSFMANMIDAVAICEPVVDAAGQAADIRVVAVNPALLRALALPADRVAGRTASAILPGMDRRWFDRFLDVARSRSPVAIEEPFPALGGWYRVAAFPVRGGRVAVVFDDITGQTAAEAALRERDLRLNLALDAAAVGVFDWNPLTGEETWDDRTRQQWGLPPGAPVDHAVFEAGVHPDDRAAVAAAIRRALDPAGDGRYEARYRVVGHGDGAERRIASRGQAVFEGGRAARMIGTTIDVTERERAAEAVRARERLVQSIFRAAPVGIGLVTGLDSGRRIEQVNDHLLEMTGYDRDELIGRESRILYTDDRAHAAVVEESAFQLEEFGRGEVETRWRRKDGTVIEILLSSSLISPPDAGAGVIFTALDITNLRETEIALMRYARDLRHSNEELQRFAYVASHDLQEPLRSIISFSQLLERRYRGKLDSDADEFIAFIVEGGTRMQRLIQDLLQVSRVETGGREPVPTDPAAVVYAAARSLDEAVRGAGATVTVGDLPAVLADPAQLEQVFANLVSNAIKYRRPGVPPEVRISAGRLDGLVEFAVADNGIGIESEYFDRIFQMFRRLHTHDQYEGTGIGLAVVKRIVERHGGTVRVESAPGEGSTFYFTLPAA